MSFWNGWSERVLLDICFLIALGQSTSHHAVQVTDSGECVSVRLAASTVYYTDYLVFQTTKSVWTDIVTVLRTPTVFRQQLWLNVNLECFRTFLNFTLISWSSSMHALLLHFYLLSTLKIAREVALQNIQGGPKKSGHRLLTLILSSLKRFKKNHWKIAL